nr:hypothetical protein [Nocardia cyriacigeorgica]
MTAADLCTGATAAECPVHMLVVVRDPTRCAARVSQLLERACHRWRRRVNAGGLAALHRWSAAELAGLAPGARCPIDVIETVAAGIEVTGRALGDDLATVLTLHAVCPVVAESVTVSAPARPGLVISIYGSAADDVGLAEALVDVLALDQCLTVTGRITHRPAAVSSAEPGSVRRRPLPEVRWAPPGLDAECPEEVAVTAEPARMCDGSHRLVPMVHQ